MKLWIVLLTVVACVALWGAEPVLHGRVQVIMETDTKQRANQLVNRLNTLVKQTDKKVGENRGFEAWIVDEGSAPYIVQADYIFATNATATTAFLNLSNAPTAGIHGQATLHFCPDEGAEGWRGCTLDPRSQWRVITW